MPSFSSARRAILFSLIAAATLLFVSAPAWAAGSAAPQLLPYTTTVLAGGGPATTYAAGNLCPVSGLTMTDTYGNGCLATEVVLNEPRYVTQDSHGNYFFSDTTSFSVRRIDATTGVITLVAGGGKTPAGVTKTRLTVGATCPSGIGTVTDISGDGCPGTDAFLGSSGTFFIGDLTFSPAGDLYFGEAVDDLVHKIAATGGVITTTGTMTLASGDPTVGFGWQAGDPTCTLSTCSVNIVNEPIPFVSGTGSRLDAPYGVRFDTAGNLYILEEGKNSILVVNNTGASQTVTGISIPAGDITKIMGADSTTVPACINGTTGCPFGKWTDGNHADASQLDSPYQLVLDSADNIYFTNEFTGSVGRISTANIITTYAGKPPNNSLSSAPSNPQSTRAVVGVSPTTNNFGIGSNFGIAIDSSNNIYVSDASATEKYIWRIDSGSQEMYVVAGGVTSAIVAGSACPGGAGFGTATDTFGDGCPGLQTKFSGSASSGANFAVAANPGVAGLYVDSAGNLIAADTIAGLIRKVASGTAFGNTQTGNTQTLDIHFGIGDSPAGSNPYVLTSGAANFSLPTGTVPCTVNSDNTQDCQLVLTVAATANGPFTGTLQVTSAHSLVSTFPLEGTIVAPVASSTTVTANATCPPGGVSTITVTVSNPIGFASGGNVTIFVNGTQINQQVLPVTRKVTTTFSFTPGATYTVLATYSGDAHDLASTTTTETSATVTSGPLALATPPGANSTITVAAGGTALYSFTATAYTSGTYSFSCTGPPAGAACVFYPSSSTTLTTTSGTACQAGNTIAMSVTTTQPQPVVYGFGGIGKGKWALLGTLPALLLAMLVMALRRRSPLKYSGALMALAFLVAMAGTLGCGAGYGPSAPGTPGSQASPATTHFTVTGTDGLGDTSQLTLTLIVN